MRTLQQQQRPAAVHLVPAAVGGAELVQVARLYRGHQNEQGGQQYQGSHARQQWPVAGARRLGHVCETALTPSQAPLRACITCSLAQLGKCSCDCARRALDCWRQRPSKQIGCMCTKGQGFMRETPGSNKHQSAQRCSKPTDDKGCKAWHMGATGAHHTGRGSNRSRRGKRGGGLTFLPALLPSAHCCCLVPHVPQPLVCCGPRCPAAT